MDNGVQQYPPEISPKYRNRTDLSARVGWLNPAWNEPTDSQTVDVRPASCLLGFCLIIPTFQAKFEKASTLTGEEFLGRLLYYGKAWLPARDIVVQGLQTRSSVDPSSRIVLFEHFAPWKVIISFHCTGCVLTRPSTGTSLRIREGVIHLFG